MRVLIDECLPRHLAGWLTAKYEAVTVQQAGWANVRNGELLRKANESGYDVFITADKNMYFQQSFQGLRISALVIPSNRKKLVEKSVPAVVQSLERIQPGQKVVMDLGPDSDLWRSMLLHSVEQQEHHATHVFKVPGAK